MTTEKKKSESERKQTTQKKPVELDERDLEQVTGGTGTGSTVVEDPCAGGRTRTR